MEILIKDQQGAGKITNELAIEVESEKMTVRELITARVTSEVEEYNSKRPSTFTGLIRPDDTEAVLNGYKLRGKKVIDPERQVYVALDSFQKNGFFILVDKKQVMTLDEEVSLHEKSTVSFVKLTQLVVG